MSSLDSTPHATTPTTRTEHGAGTFSVPIRVGRPEQGGDFYLVQLAPDLAPQRVKFGRAMEPTKRLLTHRYAALREAPIDDEPETDEERAAVAEAEAAIAVGDVVHDKDLHR